MTHAQARSRASNRPSPVRGLLRIGELAAASDLPVSTVRHYAREGLLGEPLKTSRNMAYYPPQALQRIALVKSLQEELFLPLKVIGMLLQAFDELDPEDEELVLEVRARLLDHHRERLPDVAGVPEATVRRLHLTGEELGALAEEGVVTPTERDGAKVYDELDYRILKALSDVRGIGMTPDLATVHDLGLYVGALRQLAHVEARLFAKRIGKGRDAGQVVELIRQAIPAVNEVMAALHHKLLLSELGSGTRGEQ